MEAIKQVWEGKAGLAKTYWGWGFLGGIPWSIALALAPAGSAIAILLVVAALAYCVLVNVGVWRAATAYAGPPTWAMLAKVVAALGVFFVLVAAVTIGLAMSGRSLVVPGAVPRAVQAAPDNRPSHCKKQIDDFLDGKIDRPAPECQRSPSGN